MLSKTQAIVLHLSPYKDNSSILHLYSEEYGRISCSVFGNKYKFLKIPLNIIEVELYQKSDQSKIQLREAQLTQINNNIEQDICKQTIALFIAEILYRVLKHELKDSNLYQFLVAIINELNSTSHPENVHILFLLGFAERLGFALDYEAEENKSIVELLAKTTLSRQERQSLLNKLCLYFEQHIEDFAMPKSLEVLQSIFD